MTPRSLFNKSFALSAVLHAGFLGLLALLAWNPPRISDAPLTVRILEQPGGPLGPLAVVPRVPDRPLRDVQRLRDQPPSPERPAKAFGLRASSEPGGSGALNSPPQVAAPQLPERPKSPSDVKGEVRQDLPPPVPPERSGLSLGGPAQATPSPPEARPGASGTGAVRPSLREQIASLGSGLEGDAGGTARQTVSLESKDPQFISYLARVKRRIERVWVYPEEALNHGVGGELLLVFTLNKTGSLTNIRLVQSSGFPILDEEALRAVKLAAPFDPFPPQMGEEPWNVSASFRYNLPYRFRRN